MITVNPTAEVRIILDTVRSSLDETTNPSAGEKLQWLQAEVEACLNSLASPSGQAAAR
jgi:hypothetical protein